MQFLPEATMDKVRKFVDEMRVSLRSIPKKNMTSDDEARNLLFGFERSIWYREMATVVDQVDPSLSLEASRISTDLQEATLRLCRSFISESVHKPCNALA